MPNLTKVRRSDGNCKTASTNPWQGVTEESTWLLRSCSRSICGVGISVGLAV